jgi:hypothetical protein
MLGRALFTAAIVLAIFGMIHEFKREQAVVSTYCRSHDMAGYSLGGKFVPPSCIDRSGKSISLTTTDLYAPKAPAAPEVVAPPVPDKVVVAPEPTPLPEIVVPPPPVPDVARPIPLPVARPHHRHVAHHQRPFVTKTAPVQINR